jgi:hypothetical protein
MEQPSKDRKVNSREARLFHKVQLPGPNPRRIYVSLVAQMVVFINGMVIRIPRSTRIIRVR